MAHVRTQMPYAALIAIVAIVCGTIPVGYGISSLYLLPLGVVAMIVALFVFGRAAESEA